MLAAVNACNDPDCRRRRAGIGAGLGGPVRRTAPRRGLVWHACVHSAVPVLLAPHRHRRAPKCPPYSPASSLKALADLFALDRIYNDLIFRRVLPPPLLLLLPLRMRMAQCCAGEGQQAQRVWRQVPPRAWH